MTRARMKSKAVNAAQSREEVEQLIEVVGDLTRTLTRIEADLGDAIARTKAEFERRAELPKIALLEAQTRIQGWCEANRAELTGGKTKTAAFATGEVKWRLRPPSATVRSAEAVIAWLKENLGGRFVRTKEEVDKEAILANAASDAPVAIPGVTVKSAGEDFVIEPFTAELKAGV